MVEMRELLQNEINNHFTELYLTINLSQLISPKLLQSGVTAGSSHSILTWQQLLGQETAQNLFPVLKNIYNDKNKLQKTRQKI